MSLIVTRDLVKDYPLGPHTVHALRGVGITIERGDFVAVMGPSGSGKSTLLNLIGGIDRATSGSIEFAGRRLEDMNESELARWRARHVGFIFQMHHLLPMLTAQDNVELPLLLTGFPGAERRRRAAAALKLVGLADRVKHKPAELSGGQEQRVGVARAIVTDPDILLCDEPTGDLDRKAGDAILDLLQALNGEHGKTIVMVTHDPHAAVRAKRTLYFDQGVLVTQAAM